MQAVLKSKGCSVGEMAGGAQRWANLLPARPKSSLTARNPKVISTTAPINPTEVRVC